MPRNREIPEERRARQRDEKHRERAQKRSQDRWMWAFFTGCLILAAPIVLAMISAELTEPGTAGIAAEQMAAEMRWWVITPLAAAVVVAFFNVLGLRRSLRNVYRRAAGR